MNDKLRELFFQYHVDKAKDFKYLISDLESDIDTLMAVDASNYDDFTKATQLISDYGIQLNNQGYVKKAKKYMDKGIQNIEIDEKLKGTDLFNDELYPFLIWTRGQINYTLKNYRLASKDFKTLALRFPDNDRYKNWYNGSISYFPNQLQWFFASLIFLSLFAKYVTGFKSDLINYLDWIGLIGLPASWIYKLTMKIK
jgi:hypothetical protein